MGEGGAAGTVQRLLQSEFPLSEAEQAFRFMAHARHIGKLVLTVREPHYEAWPDTPIFSADATYLITGGLGGVCLAVAGWMVRRRAQPVVLVGPGSAPLAPNESA